jgi:Tfp pilus assembly protein PilW
MNRGNVIGSNTPSMHAVRMVCGACGVCLAELMISVTVGAIVLAAALNALNLVQTHVRTQQRDLTHQQDLRLGLEVFEQEVRLAVSDSITSATPNEFLFHANIGAYRTVTTRTAGSGQSVLAVEDGGGWGEGKVVIICGPQACETSRLSRSGQRYQLTLTEPLTMSFPAGASVEVSNRVAYYTKRDENGTMKLMRMVDGGANTLIGNLESLRFSYWDEQGHVTEHPSLVKRVVLEIKSNHRLHRMMREVSLRS